MKLLVVDDEPLARSRLRRMLEELGHTDVVEAESAESARRVLRERAIDLVLLDVNMPGLDGLSFAALERLPTVIFVTGDPSHAAKAFDVEAADFVTKPVRRERLARAIARAKKSAALGADGPEPAVRLRVIDADRERFVDARQVEVFRAEHKYVAFTLGGEELLVRESLDELELRLREAGFVRAHRSYLVRLSAIRALSHDEPPMLSLGSGASVPVSRRALGPLRERLRA